MAAPAATAEDATEMLACCRYGELEDAMALLDAGVLVDSVDSAGNTALHLSCANGHEAVVAMLLTRGARHLPNSSGNTPLHWAVSSKHKACVRLLLEGLPDSARLNVLAKNEFGKSAITEGFVSGDHEVVRMVLEHQSAEEDMLLQASSLGSGKTAAGEAAGGGGGGNSGDGGSEEEDDDIADAADDRGAAGAERGASLELEDKEEAEVLHEFGFGERRAPLMPPPGANGDCVTSRTVAGAASSAAFGNAAAAASSGLDADDGGPMSFEVRELAIRNADDPFGSEPSQDQTGLGVWAAAVVMARWLAGPALSVRLQGAAILELGAGCGVSGLSAAVHARPSRLVLTDLNPETVANLAHNVELNRRRFHAASRPPPPPGSPSPSPSGAAETPSKSPPSAAAAAAAGMTGAGASEGGSSSGSSTGSGGSGSLDGSWSGGRHVFVATLDWGDTSTWPVQRSGEGFDFVIGCDLIYHKPAAPLLANAIAGMCRRGGTFLYVAPDTGRDGLPEFFAALALRGFAALSAEQAPEHYKENPLLSGSEGDYLLYFNELQRPHMLYEFRRRLDVGPEPGAR